LTVLDFVAKSFDLLLEFALLDQLANLDSKRIELEGFRDEISRPAFHGFDGSVHGVSRRQYDDGCLNAALAEFGEQIETVTPGHHEVKQDQIRRGEDDFTECRVDIAGDHHFAFGFQQHAQGFLHARLIIHD